MPKDSQTSADDNITPVGADKNVWLVTKKDNQETGVWPSSWPSNN